MILFPCSGCCPCGWVESNSFCYFMNGSSEVKWDDARTMCQEIQKDADLAVITSETQNEFLYGLINSKTQDSWYGTWIGSNEMLKMKTSSIGLMALHYPGSTRTGLVESLTATARNAACFGDRQHQNLTSGMTPTAISPFEFQKERQSPLFFARNQPKAIKLRA